MEKLMYLLWKPDGAGQAWPQAMHQLASALCQQGACRLRLCLDDADVAPAAAMRLSSPGIPLPDAIIAFWMDSASQRAPYEALLQEVCRQLAGYTVAESEPLPNTLHPASGGARTHGMNHVVFLQVPPRLTREEWLSLWHDGHTAVAIETQQTFGYRQNVVVRRLTADAPPVDAIVEENFPPAAMTEQDAFYRRSTAEELATNQKRMYQSCKRFIDFDKMGRLPTSEYNYN